MNNSIFIPKKIRVGFQKRDDTYSGKLAYVIYYDQKGKLRKATSWDGWRDQKIEPEEYENVPTEGFVLNKKVGGYKYYFDARQTYVRVFDPRGFEFEITVPNLLYILEHTSSIKGKGLEGEFVYGWDGTALVLLPTDSPDYKDLTQLNDKRFDQKKILAKDLIPGHEYLGTNNKRYVYMGQFDAYQDVYHFDGKQFSTAGALERYAHDNELPLNDSIGSFHRYDVYGGDNRKFTYGPGNVGKHYFFYSEDEYNNFKLWKSVSGKLLEDVSDGPVPQFPELMEKLETSTIYSPIDHSKDEIIPLPQDEINTKLTRAEYWFGPKFLVEVNGQLEELQVHKAEPSGFYTCSFTYRSDSSTPKLKDYFKFYCEYGRVEKMVPVTAEEIFNKFPPFYINEYLTNGKFYRKRYNYD